MLFTSKSTGTAHPEECPVGYYKCTNKRCIPIMWRCNGANECGDNSDEEYCTSELFKEILTKLVYIAAECPMQLCCILFCEFC